MKDYKEMDQLVFEFGEDLKKFVQNHAGLMPPVIKTQLQDLMYTKFAKEIDTITEQEEVEIKFKKRFYDKLLRSKIKLAKLDRADAWLNKLFGKYFNKGLLEHLIVHAIMYLNKQNLFVPQRLFAQLNDDELLAQFTISACERLGWTGQNDVVEQPTMDENEPAEEQSEASEIIDEGAEQLQDETESTDVAVYEPKEVQSVEQSSQPVVKVERTVTHEVMTATQQVQENAQVVGREEVADSDIATDTSVISEENAPHRFHRPGGGKHK